MSRITKRAAGVEESKAGADAASASAAHTTRKEVFNLYGCDLSAPRRRIGELCKEYPTIALAIKAWRKERMEDPKLLAKYENLEDFVDFNLSQFLQLTSEFTIQGAYESDGKIFVRNFNFEYNVELRKGFRAVIEVIEREVAKVVRGSVRGSELKMVVGSWYYNGNSDEQRRARNIYLSELDSKYQGYAIAQRNSAVCLEDGIGGPKHKSRARRLYRLAANQGYAISQNNFAACLEQGIGGPKDEAKAIEFYELAANQGYAIAQTNLAACLERIGGTENELEAKRLYQLAADQGLAVAQYNLGNCFCYGICGEKDNSLALLYYSRSAAQKNPDAISNLEFSGHLKLKIIPPHTSPLPKDQILEIINNLVPEKVRIFNKASHIIGDLVEASKSTLEAADLFEIHECLSGHLTASKVDPMQSKSCEKIRNCITERIKSEIGDGLVDEVKYLGFDDEVPPAKSGHVEVFNPLHERGLNFRIVSEGEEGLGGVKIVHNTLFGGAAAAVWALDQKLQEMQKAGKLTYNSESKTITVTKANLETFSAMSVPTADVGGAGASAVVGGEEEVVRGGGGGGGSGSGSGRD